MTLPACTWSSEHPRQNSPAAASSHSPQLGHTAGQGLGSQTNPSNGIPHPPPQRAPAEGRRAVLPQGACLTRAVRIHPGPLENPSSRASWHVRRDTRQVPSPTGAVLGQSLSLCRPSHAGLEQGPPEAKCSLRWSCVSIRPGSVPPLGTPFLSRQGVNPIILATAFVASVLFFIRIPLPLPQLCNNDPARRGTAKCRGRLPRRKAAVAGGVAPVTNRVPQPQASQSSRKCGAVLARPLSLSCASRHHLP